MTVRIVVIPEDDRLDKFVLQPVFEAMLALLDKPHARVKVVDNPQPRGIATVLEPEFADRVVARFPFADVYVYCLDRDGRVEREWQLDAAVARLRLAAPGGRAEGILAVQEAEVWCLINHVSELDDPWPVVRSEPHPKERYFDPLVSRTLPMPGPGKGRQALGSQAARRYDLLRERCPELQKLEEALKPHLGGTA